MCLADFQMGKRTQAVTSGQGTATVNLSANPRRLRVIVGTLNGTVRITKGGTDTGNTIGYAGDSQRNVDGEGSAAVLVMKLEEWGTLLLGDLTFVAVGVSVVFCVDDILALPDLDNLISNGAK